MTELAEQETLEVEPVIEGEGETLTADNDAGDDDEVIVSIGDAPPPEQEPTRTPEEREWLKNLRKSEREKAARVKELEALLAAKTETKPVELGPEPTLEGAEYDGEKFKANLLAWSERKREIEAEERKAKAAREVQDAEWQGRLDGYQKAKQSLRVKDYEDAEAVILESFDATKQGIIINGAENPALLVYAIGKAPEKAKELAAITDPIKFAFAVAKLETQVKATTRKAPPPPERTINGGSSGGAIDNTLERLRAKASETGNFDEVAAYIRKRNAA